MNWKDILKMPMPLDTRATRDEEHKQAITEYEKSVIEPKLVEHVRSQPSTEEKSITMSFHNKSTDEIGRTNKGGIYYVIGADAVEKLGKNKNYILKVIGDLYQAEGYDIDRNSRFDGEVALEFRQPRQGE